MLKGPCGMISMGSSLRERLPCVHILISTHRQNVFYDFCPFGSIFSEEINDTETYQIYLKLSNYLLMSVIIYKFTTSTKIYQMI